VARVDEFPFLVPLGTERLHESDAAHAFLEHTHHLAVVVVQPAIALSQAGQQRTQRQYQRGREDERDEREPARDAPEIRDVDDDDGGALNSRGDDLRDELFRLGGVGEDA
jgi:hypothetical protein